MKLSIIFLFLLCSFHISFSQIEGTSVTQNDHIKTRLVELALKRVPELQIAQYNVLSSKRKHSLAKLKWLSNISATANFNEYNLGFKKFEDNQNFLIPPNYNFSFGLNLGDIFTNIYGGKMAKSQHMVAQLESETVKTNIKIKVLSLYEDYLLAKELLGLQSMMTDDFEVKANLNETKYDNGEITYKEYKSSSFEYNQSRMKKAHALTNLEKSKISLEIFLGVSIDELENSY